MYCNQCGKQIPDGSRFCNYCGANLTAVQAAPRPAPVQSDSYFDIRHGVLVKYKGREKNVVVPAGVVEIEENAFTGYDMESITIPEGCRKVHIDTFVKVIRFPSTIEEFLLDAGKISFPDCARRPANDVFFAPGTKTIAGTTPFYYKENGDSGMKFYIPSSVVKIEEHYFHLGTLASLKGHEGGIKYVYDNIDLFAPNIRAVIYRKEGRCPHCGGEFQYVRDGLAAVITGKRCYKCKVCGRKKE